jgi:hypothetical protein
MTVFGNFLRMEFEKEKSVQASINTRGRQLDGLYERIIYRLVLNGWTDR